MTVTVAISLQLSGVESWKLAKNRNIKRNVAHSKAAPIEGVSPRFLTRCRSHTPGSTRSLSRKRTDSLLNWSMAQRIANRQQIEVIPMTGMTWTNASR